MKNYWLRVIIMCHCVPGGCRCSRSDRSSEQPRGDLTRSGAVDTEYWGQCPPRSSWCVWKPRWCCPRQVWTVEEGWRGRRGSSEHWLPGEVWRSWCDAPDAPRSLCWSSPAYTRTLRQIFLVFVEWWSSWVCWPPPPSLTTPRAPGRWGRCTCCSLTRLPPAGGGWSCPAPSGDHLTWNMIYLLTVFMIKTIAGKVARMSCEDFFVIKKIPARNVTNWTKRI